MSGVSKTVLQYPGITEMDWGIAAGEAGRKHFSAANYVIVKNHYEDEIDH